MKRLESEKLSWGKVEHLHLQLVEPGDGRNLVHVHRRRARLWGQIDV